MQRATTSRDQGYRDGIEERPLLPGLQGIRWAERAQRDYVDGWLEGRAARMRIAARAAVEVAGQVISELRLGDRPVAPQGPAAPGVEVNRSVALAKRLGEIWQIADAALTTHDAAAVYARVRRIRALTMGFVPELAARDLVCPSCGCPDPRHRFHGRAVSDGPCPDPFHDLTSDDIPDPADTPRDAARLAEEEARDPGEDE